MIITSLSYLLISFALICILIIKMLQICSHIYKNIDDDQLWMNLETFIIVFLHSSCKSDVALNFFKLDHKPDDFLFNINSTSIRFSIVSEGNNYCYYPIAKDDNIEISGLCSVARKLIKCHPDEDVKKLLGFREACLMACNESSVWTKFCEIDMIKSVKDICKTQLLEFVPQDLTRFEYHLEQPVRIHNVYKVAREFNSTETIESSIPLEKLNINHQFGEGPFMTLADIILFPSVYIIKKLIGSLIFKSNLPLVNEWLNSVGSQNVKFRTNILLLDGLKVVQNTSSTILKNVEFDSKVPKQSLYISDPNRYKPRNRIFTKQADIEVALKCIDEASMDICNENTPYGYEIPFSWDDVPEDALRLPKNRTKRKQEQLENMAKAVKALAQPGDVLVDFCSGSGHLGILLAVLLPKCHVILLENKERSLGRALETVQNVGLHNVTLLQCNLDYFRGSFGIGVSLHACGVATDLVIDHCLRVGASFVSCPCCYGGVHDCHHLTYPRSAAFKEFLVLHDYLVLGHAADQTHDNENAKTVQGYRCMDVIDTDRKLYAESKGYEVHLGKLQPTTCTPKNNILIGIRK